MRGCLDAAGPRLPKAAAPSRARRVRVDENLGGISRGTMESAPPALVFAAAQYVEGGKAMTYRTRWTKVDDGTYEVLDEAENKGAWAPTFKLAMKRNAAAQ